MHFYSVTVSGRAFVTHETKRLFVFSSAISKIATANHRSSGGITLFRNLKDLIPDRKAFRVISEGISEYETESASKTSPELMLLYCQMKTTEEDPPRLFCRVWRNATPYSFLHKWEDGDLLALNAQTHSVEQRGGGPILMNRIVVKVGANVKM